MTDKPLRVVLTARISKNTDASTSIDKQLASMRREAEAKGWVVVSEHSDIDVSATKRRLKREGIQGALAAIREGRADALVCHRLDRVARSVKDIADLVDEDVRIIATDQGIDSGGTMGKVFIYLAGIFAELEAQTISERITATRAHLASTHKHGGGITPYGYRSIPHPSGKGRALEVDPEEAGHIRAAADHVLSGGSLYSAVHVLRDRGSKPRRADAWALKSVRVVLTGDAVLGRLTHRGMTVRDPETGLPVQPWPAVLPVEDAHRLRALLESKPVGERRTRATRLLSGLVQCAGCKGNMRVSTRTVKGKVVLSYQCKAWSDGRECEHPASINAELLESFIETGFLDLTGDLQYREQITMTRDVPELADVNASLTELAAQITAPGADVAALAGQIGALQARRADLESVPAEPLTEYRETGKTFAEWWLDNDDTAARRDLLRASLGRVRVKPGQRGRKGLDASRVSFPDWEAGASPTIPDSGAWLPSPFREP